MTKAYIEGFNKTAEAYGVDPEALMKFAAGEFAGAKPPYTAIRTGTEDIPSVFPGDPSFTSYGLFNPKGEYPEPESIDSFYSRAAADALRKNQSRGETPESIAALEYGVTDPKYWGAHTTAVDRATAPWRKAVSNGANSMNSKIRDAIVRKYHNEMASLTGTPTRVSAPLSKVVGTLIKPNMMQMAPKK